jgi:hypothetical protein
MPYLTNSIANFNFISLEGEYDPEQPSLMIDSRPGVTGMDFTLTATKGQPFTLISLADVNSLASGKQAVRDYKTLIGLGTVAIWKNSELYMFAKVLNVTPFRLDRISTAVGNKQSALAQAILQCRWDLVAAP